MRVSRSSDAGVNLGVIITPFLDMAFQLLAFFIMTYNPSSLEANVQGSLAVPKGAGKGEAIGGEPNLEQTMLVIVKAVMPGQVEGQKHDGEPSRILIKRVEDAAPVPVAEADITNDEAFVRLQAELRAAAKAGAGGQIHIESDGNLKHHFLMRVYDVCRAAGWREVAFVAPAVARR